MNYPLPGVLVDPQGVSTSVAITDSHGKTPTVYADRFAVTTITMPDTITARKTYYLPGEGPWTVTPTANGEVTAATTLTLEDAQIATVTVGSAFTAGQWSQLGAFEPLRASTPRPRLSWTWNKVENGLFLTDYNTWTETGRGASNQFSQIGSTSNAATSYPSGRWGISQGGSLLQSVDSVASGGHYIDSPPVAVDTTKTYVASIWAQTVSGTATTYVNIACVDKSGGITNLRIINGVTPPGTWTQYALQINPADWPANTVAAFIRAYGAYNAVGTINYADAMLGRLSELTQGSLTYSSAVAMGAHELHLDSTGQNVWVLNFNAGTVGKLNTLGVFQSETAMTGQSYIHDLSDDGTYLWVVDQNNNKLGQVRLSDGTLVNTFSVPGTPKYTFGCHCFGGNVWTASAGQTPAASTINVFSPGPNTWTTYASTGFESQSGNASICDDGTNIWVASEVTNQVIKINPANGAVLATVTLPFAPYGIGSDGTYVYAGGTTNTIGQNSWSGTIPNRRAEVVRILASSATITDVRTLPAGLVCETNWKWDKTRYMYAWGSPDVGGPIPQPGGLTVASQGGPIRWDTQKNVLEAFPGPYGRMKGVEPVGRELWAVCYMSLDWFRFEV